MFRIKTPYLPEMLRGLKQNLVCTRTQRPQRYCARPALSIQGSLQWHGSAVACHRDRDSGCSRPRRPSVWHKSSWRRSPVAPPQSHRADNPQTGEQLYQRSSHTVTKVLGPTKISQPGDLAKGRRTPREFYLGHQWDLITEFPQDWETDSWRAQTKPCAHQDPGERSSDPTKD